MGGSAAAAPARVFGEGEGVELIVGEAEEGAAVGLFVGAGGGEHQPWQLAREIGWGFGS